MFDVYDGLFLECVEFNTIGEVVELLGYSYVGKRKGIFLIGDMML